MFEKFSKRHTSMASSIRLAIVELLVVFGIIVSVIGVVVFTNTFKEENSTTTYHIANTAALLVNGDHIDEYLAGGEKEEYDRTKRILDSFCKRMSVSLVYAIAVDESDYGRFVSIFNALDNSVDDSHYTEWELGHERETTNEEYRRTYRELYEKKIEYGTIYRLRPGQGLNPHVTTLVPIKDSNGDVAAIMCVQRPIHELESVVKRFMATVVVSMIVLAMLASRLASRSAQKWVIDPVGKISEEAARFAKENTKGEELGDVSKFEEIATLSSAIDKMETDMVSYVENLTAVTAEKERISTELSFARQIQYSALPNKYPAFPERPEFDIYGSMTPAKEVGGDFYNFMLIDDDHLALWIGDVSDKGVPAALFMMSANIVIENRTSMGGTPAQIMGFVNDNICAHNNAEMFITIWLGIFEISTGKLVFVNAGHEDLALYRKGGSFELYKTRHNLATGAMAGIEYRDYEIRLEKGDKLFLYTDGVPEATDAQNRLFTLDSMTDALNRYREGTPQEILDGIHVSVKEFVGDRRQFDDLTMLCLERK